MRTVLVSAIALAAAAAAIPLVSSSRGLTVGTSAHRLAAAAPAPKDAVDIAVRSLCECEYPDDSPRAILGPRSRKSTGGERILRKEDARDLLDLTSARHKRVASLPRQADRVYTGLRGRDAESSKPPPNLEARTSPDKFRRKSS
ncbi:hypothetical protein B0H15DRAFT_816288, partial [Mycena belliarum]